MALQTIRFGSFAGVKQGVSAGGIPLNWAENAQNVNTAGGKLDRAKGYRAIYPSVTGAARKLRRLFIWPRESGQTDCLVARQDSLFRYDPTEEAWEDLYHYTGDMNADTFDFLKTKIGSTETLLIGNGLEPILKWVGGSSPIAAFGSAQGLSDKAVNFLELYFGRLFAAGDREHPARLYWSQAPGDGRTIEDWSADESSENVSGGHVEVGTDSDPITGLFALSNQLLIFKKDKLYRLLGDRPGNYRIVPVEAALAQPIHTACVLYGDRLFFLTDKGLYFYDGQTVRRTAHGADLVPLLQQVDFSAAASAACGDTLYFAVKEHAASVHNDLLIEYDVLRDCFLLRRGPDQLLRHPVRADGPGGSGSPQRGGHLRRGPHRRLLGDPLAGRGLGPHHQAGRGGGAHGHRRALEGPGPGGSPGGGQRGHAPGRRDAHGVPAPQRGPTAEASD